jgi:hypothetical protein
VGDRSGPFEAAGLGRARLAWLQATHRRRPALALAICLLAAIALPALLPLLAAMGVETELANTLARDGGVTVTQPVADVDAFANFQRDVDLKVSSALGSDLVPLGAYASAGPLAPASVRGLAPSTAVAAKTLTATFADHLAAHVVAGAGELPPDGLGGGETAVTMPQAGADQLGVQLSDRICFDFTSGADRQPRWCARIVGLWKPVDAHDPFWGGSTPGLVVFMGRSDFFGLAQLHPPQGPQAGLRYWAQPGQVDPSRTASVAAQVHHLRTGLVAPQRIVSTRLDTSLADFDASQRLVSSLVQPFSIGVALLGLFVVTLVAARFLDGQASGLAVLKARGWSQRRVWRVAFWGLVALAGWSAVGALAASTVVVVALTATGWVSVLPLRGSDLGGVAIAAIACTAGLLGVLIALSASVVQQDLEPSMDPPFRRAPSWWQRGTTTLALAGLAVPAVLVPRLAGPQGAVAGTILALVTAVGMVLLAAAVAYVSGLAARGPSGGDIGGLLARAQLRRHPEQHGGAVYVLLLASALVVYAAIALAAVLTTGRTSSQPALVTGVALAFITGGVAALALALVGFGLHFSGITAQRLAEYSGLFAHGLAPNQVARSLAAEQSSVATTSLIAGTLLGLILAVISVPLANGSRLMTSAGIGVGVVVAGFVVCVVLVAPVARRMPAVINLMAKEPRW